MARLISLKPKLLVGRVSEVRCEKCGHKWFLDWTGKKWEDYGWKKIWSWRRFRFILICEACNI